MRFASSYLDAATTMRLTAFVLVALTASLLAAGTAVAGTVGIDGDTLRYDAAPGEFNQLAIMLQSGRFTIQDGYSQTRDTLFVTALAPCVRDTTPQPDPGMTDAYCPPDGVTRIAVALGDQSDEASIGGITATDYPAAIDGGDGADRIFGGPQADVVHGGAGSDTLTGGGGRDVLSGDDGDDSINAADGLPDQITCGPGFDAVTADPLDTVADDCEVLNGQPWPPPDTTAPTLQLSGASSQRIARQRAVVVVIACPAEACTATARGTIAVPGSAKAFKLTPVTKQISAGSKATLKLGITKRALTAIGRALKHHKRLSARLTVSAQDAAKNVTAKQRTIRLKR